MLFYIFLFISSLILISIINSMLHHIYSGINFNSQYTSQIQYGRILNFKTKKSILNKYPIFKH